MFAGLFVAPSSAPFAAFHPPAATSAVITGWGLLKNFVFLLPGSFIALINPSPSNYRNTTFLFEVFLRQDAMPKLEVYVSAKCVTTTIWLWNRYSSSGFGMLEGALTFSTKRYRKRTILRLGKLWLHSSSIKVKRLPLP